MTNIFASAGLGVSLAILALILKNISWALFLLRPSPLLPDLWVPPGSSCYPLSSTLSSSSPEVVQGFNNCEDAEYVEFDVGGGSGEGKVVVISCDKGRREWNTVMGRMIDPKPKGNLYLHTPSLNLTSPLPLLSYPSQKDFHPLGITIYPYTAAERMSQKLPKGSGGGVVWGRLFVVNHGEVRGSLEVFDLIRGEGRGEWQARYIRTLTHPLATHAPNSLHPLSPTHLFVTQDHFFPRRPPPLTDYAFFLSARVPFLAGAPAELLAGWLSGSPYVVKGLNLVENYLGLPTDWVAEVEFDDRATMDAGEGVRARVAVNRIPYANGLVLTDSGNTMVVASITQPGIFVYRRNLALPERDFELYQKIHLPFLVDNLSISRAKKHDTDYGSDNDDEQEEEYGNNILENQTIIAAGHPDVALINGFAEDPKAYSPSWVVSVKFDPRVAERVVREGNGQGKGKKDLEFDQTEGVASESGRVEMQTRLLSTPPPGWIIKTLYQSSGNPAVHGALASATTGLELPGGRGLLVSGLYDGVVVCEGVKV